MDKATEIVLNQSVLGACFIISITVIFYLFKLLWKIQEKRIKERDEIIADFRHRLSEKKDETHQTFMDYLSTVHTMVGNTEKMMEKFIDAFASFKAFIEMIVETKKRGGL